MRTVPNVDIDQFMGDWYVIASIPTYFERNAIDPIENYQRDKNGNIATTFTFVRNGEQKTMRMTAFAKDEPDNGIWAMQFVWPFRADYRIAYLDDDYATTIIGRNKRDYLWIMARSPGLGSEQLEQLINTAVQLGYARKDIQLSSWQQRTQRELSFTAARNGSVADAL